MITEGRTIDEMKLAERHEEFIQQRGSAMKQVTCDHCKEFTQEYGAAVDVPLFCPNCQQPITRYYYAPGFVAGDRVQVVSGDFDGMEDTVQFVDIHKKTLELTGGIVGFSEVINLTRDEGWREVPHDVALRQPSPGPWTLQASRARRVSGAEYMGYVIRDKRNCNIAVVGRVDAITDGGEGWANARLMQAAPELFQIMEQIRENADLAFDDAFWAFVNTRLAEIKVEGESIKACP